MAKKKCKINISAQKSLMEIEETRLGGQNALIGFDYQCLYSCYVLLSFLQENRSIRFEGIEDIDTYITDDNITIEHIQLKHSNDKQDGR